MDKPKIEAEDYDNVSYPLVELDWSLNECISPVLYTMKERLKYHLLQLIYVLAYLKSELARILYSH